MSRHGRRGRSNKGGAFTPRGGVGFPTPRGGMAVAEPFTPASDPGAAGTGAAALHVDEPTLAHEASTAATAERLEPVAAASGSAALGETEPRSFVDFDDASYPPVDLDNHFFGGNGPLRVSEPPIEADERDPRMSLKQTPEVARRRANLQKYVKVAVAAASALCVAALFKVAVTRSASHEESRSPVDLAAAAPRPEQNPVPLAAEPVIVAPSATETPQAADLSAPLPSDTDPAAAEPAPAEPAPADRAAVEPAPAEPDSAAAAKEKNNSRNSLEFGKVADSIEAGERSVALDSTDGEAWLILGAAYQQKGDMKNARRCYRACLDQGKRGPKYECAAMFH
jgi:Flp pilus assembly protein TadD